MVELDTRLPDVLAGTDCPTDARERANLGRREPARLAAMRARYLEWERGLPEFPEATFSVPATKADLARPS